MTLHGALLSPHHLRMAHTAMSSVATVLPDLALVLRKLADRFMTARHAFF